MSYRGAFGLYIPPCVSACTPLASVLAGGSRRSRNRHNLETLSRATARASSSEIRPAQRSAGNARPRCRCRANLAHTFRRQNSGRPPCRPRYGPVGAGCRARYFKAPFSFRVCLSIERSKSGDSGGRRRTDSTFWCYFSSFSQSAIAGDSPVIDRSIDRRPRARFDTWCSSDGPENFASPIISDFYQQTYVARSWPDARQVDYTYCRRTLTWLWK